MEVGKDLAVTKKILTKCQLPEQHMVSRKYRINAVCAVGPLFRRKKHHNGHHKLTRTILPFGAHD